MIRVLLLLLLVVSLASLPEAEAKSRPKPAPHPAWLSVAGQHADLDVAATFQSLVRSDLAWRIPGDEAGIDGLMADPKRSGILDRYRSLVVSEGEFAGNWTFYNPRRQKWPTAAVRARVSPTLPFSATADVYCAAGERDCEFVDRALAYLPTPRPQPFESPELDSAWEMLAMSEACENGPLAQPTPIYPREEVRRGISGTAELLLLYNPCGQVRAVWVVKSTGNRNLDRAAVRAAETWRLDPVHAGKVGKVRVPFEFAPDATDNPAEGKP